MKIEKKVTATIHLEQWEIEILQRFLDRARRYPEYVKSGTRLQDEDYATATDYFIDFEKVAQKILDI